MAGEKENAAARLARPVEMLAPDDLDELADVLVPEFAEMRDEAEVSSFEGLSISSFIGRYMVVESHHKAAEPVMVFDGLLKYVSGLLIPRLLPRPGSKT